MRVSFVKYHANGNDFILIEENSNFNQNLENIVPKLCERNIGIGADGIILVGLQEEYIKSRVINQDGSEAQNCGNGLRIISHWFFNINKLTHEVCVELAGKKYICRKTSNKISVNFGVCKIIKITDKKTEDKKIKLYYCDTGNKHIVVRLDNINYSKQMLEFLNVNINDFKNYNIGFFEKRDNIIFSRVFERGVGWSKSCGSGAAAAAAVCHSENLDKQDAQVLVRQAGGELKIMSSRCKNSNHKLEFNITQEGPSQKVFSGEFYLGADL